MGKVEQFIAKVEAERATIKATGNSPDINRHQSTLKRLSDKFPDLKLQPDEEVKILTQARSAMNAKNN